MDTKSYQIVTFNKESERGKYKVELQGFSFELLFVVLFTDAFFRNFQPTVIIISKNWSEKKTKCFVETKSYQIPVYYKIISYWFYVSNFLSTFQGIKSRAEQNFL